MLLDEIAQLITDNSTNRTLGSNLFKGSKQTKIGAPDTATFLHETQGLTPEFLFGSSTPWRENPGVQIINRSSDYQTARNAAELQYKILIGQTNATLKPSSSATGVLYYTINAQQAPFSIGQDDNAREQISCNFLVEKVLST